MSCIYIPRYTIRENFNVNLLNQIMSLPDGIRKELRLLAKQYELLEFNQEPNDLIERHSLDVTAKEDTYILKYRAFGGGEIFEWLIEPENCK